MKKIRIGITGPSEIALRRFLPALSKHPGFEYIGVAVANKNEWQGADEVIIESELEKALVFEKSFGGVLFNSYNELINMKNVDAIYIPLPPALHYKWAKKALLAGKHVLIEKPATIEQKHTEELILLASKRGLAVHENYMFVFHDQLNAIDTIIKTGNIGSIRLYRISFGFPRRALNDFRYNKLLGGGALLDAGGYTIKYASKLLGKNTRIIYACSQYIMEYEVDIAGSAALTNEDDIVVQVAFGMDNSYRCDLDVWGSTGSLHTGRVLTAPAGFTPHAIITKADKCETIELPADDAFLKSISHFKMCVENKDLRISNYLEIKQQARLVQEFINKTINK